MPHSTDQNQPNLSLPLRVYLMLPARLQRLLLLRAALARATLIALLAASLSLKPVQADTAFFIPSNPFAVVTAPPPSKPALADLDNDGDLDILMGESFGNFYYFKNTGSAASPAFAAPVVNPFGLVDVGYDSAPTLADLDDDGDLDLLVGDFYTGLRYFRNIGSATNPAFAAPVVDPFGLNSYSLDHSVPTLGDLDDDGDLDLLVGTGIYGDLYYFKNNGTAANPAFATPVVNPFSLTSVGYFTAPALADLDNDGDLDALVGENDGHLYYFRNTGSPTNPAFAAPVDNPFGLTDVGYSSAPALADLDNDGDLDLLVGKYDGALHYFRNSGSPANPAFNLVPLNPFGLVDVGYDSAPALADLDDDGDLDVLSGEYYGALHYFKNNGTAKNPAFAAPVTNPFGLGYACTYSTPALADLDDDGDLDVLMGEYCGDLHYFKNNGTATNPAFAAPVTNPFGLVHAGYETVPALADLDDDGDFDLLVGDYLGNLHYFRNTGSATSPAFDPPVMNPFGLANVGDYSAPALADLDQDGDLDLLVGTHDGNLFYFQNTGTATNPAFAAPVANPFGLADTGTHIKPALADLDGDGDPDLLLGEVDGRIIYFQNRSTSPIYFPMVHKR